MDRNYAVLKGGRYRAHVHLGLFESLAISDDYIAGLLRDQGFQSVNVVGEGEERWAFGTAPEDKVWVVPKQVIGVDKIA